jgi:hemin uptake protein HemP
MTAEKLGECEDDPDAACEAGGRSEPSPATASSPPSISSGELLRGGNEVLIEHAGCVYRLRLTRSGKLILHK